MARQQPNITDDDKGWLVFLSDHNFLSFTTEWDTTRKQNISCNPLYLKLRTVKVLLKVLVKISEDGEMPRNIVRLFAQADFKQKGSDDLAQIIRRLLNKQVNVEAYMGKLIQIGIAESRDRGTQRTLLLDYSNNH